MYSVVYAYKIHTTREYYILHFDRSYIEVDNILDLFINYSKLLGFNRLYTLLSKRKLTIKSLVLFVIIYTLGLPIHLIRVWYCVFIQNKGTIYDGFYTICHEE